MDDFKLNRVLVKEAGPYILVLLTFISGCATKSQPAEVKLKGEHSNMITMEEVTGNEVAKPKKVRKKNTASNKTKEKNAENCRTRFILWRDYSQIVCCIAGQK